MAMTHKERIDACLNHQPTDRTPFALVDGGAWVAKQEGLTYRQMYFSDNGRADLIVKYMDEIDGRIEQRMADAHEVCGRRVLDALLLEGEGGVAGS